MNSYNNIRKIKNTEIDRQAVSLEEYIFFVDDATKANKVVFKFKNNLDQFLYFVKFEILQYDENNNLLAKSVINYNTGKVNESAIFIPNAKLDVLYETVKISTVLLEAKFDRVVYENGEFVNSPYPTGEFQKELNKLNRENAKKVKAEQKKYEKENKRLIKLQKIRDKEEFKLAKRKYTIDDDRVSKKAISKEYKVENLTKASKAKLAKFISFVAVIAILAYTVVFGFAFNEAYANYYFSSNNDQYSANNSYEVTLLRKSIKNGTLTIPEKVALKENIKIDFNNLYESITKERVVSERVITDIGENAYTNNIMLGSVNFESKENKVRVQKNAFRNCINLSDFDFNQVTLAGDYAFANCKKLSKVSSQYLYTINGYCFTNCSSLEVVDAPLAVVAKGAFANTSSMTSLTIYSVSGDVTKLGDLFNTTNENLPSNLKSVIVKDKASLPAGFFDGTNFN